MPNTKARKIKFTSSQLEAIDHNDGAILVVAGAGTGKTAVITNRIARLILTNKAKAEQVLALTFTEKAATEMQQRVDELLPYGYVDTQIMTFHALAERVLQEFALDAGISPEFRVLNDIQQTIILQEVMSTIEFKYYSPQYDPFAFIGSIKQAISRLKDEGIDSLEFGRLTRKLADTSSGQKNAPMLDLVKIYKLYAELCARKNSLDFGDLLIKLQHLLKTRPAVKKELNERYKYVLVDEFQDTNAIQMGIISELLTELENIMVVGDDDQAIYRFRGASVQNILNFKSKFPKSKLVVLKDNFRSGQLILDAGYDLIQHNNPDRLEIAQNVNKQLIANNCPKATVGVEHYQHKLSEVDGVVEAIDRLGGGHVEHNDIAILLRKNSQIKPYILALQKKKIAYYVHQDVELFDQKSVKMLVVLAKSITDPLDSSALFQLLISGFFKDHDKHQITIISSLAHKQNKNFFDALNEESHQPWIKQAMADISLYREMLSDYTAGELLFVAIKANGFLKNLLDEAGDSIQSALSVQYMTDFFKLVKQFELASTDTGLVEFCKYLDEIKFSSADVMSDISPLDTSGVQIMTVHKAKGLEFDYVFIPELVEQSFPTYRRREDIKFPKEVLVLGEGDHYQEERRLFYVALTRARMGVFLSYAVDWGGKRPRKPSRFIGEALGSDWLAKTTRAEDQRSMAELISSFEPVIKTANQDSLLARLYRGDWLYLASSQVADYLRSPKEFWLFHILQLPKGPFHTLIYGSSIHAALEHFYKFKLKGRPISQREVLEVYKSAWRSEGFVSIEHEQALFDTGVKALNKYIKSYHGDRLKPVAIEQPFELQLPALKTVISGRYDIVLSSKDGVEIRDFKTSRIKDQKAADTAAKASIQLGIYALSWEKLQQSPVLATSLEYIEDLVVGKNTKINHEKTLELITQAVEGIKAMKFSDKGDSKLDFNKLLT
ncbi:ATP-dependent helicase [Candidatus Saccharibacteria bacterium]|nr:ATP-dependent helicase [Candidatus Saccharibacteria bacterium]